MSTMFKVALVLVALVAGACGGSDVEVQSEQTAEPTETATPTPDEPEPEPTETATPTPEEPETDEPETDEPDAPEFTGAEIIAALEVGVCFDDVLNDDGEVEFVEPIETIDCAESHDNEIYAEGEIPAGPDEPYPGVDAVHRFASTEVCDASYEEFTGVPADSPTVSPFTLAPTEEEWEQGLREVHCGVYDGLGLIGSVASAGLDASGVEIVHMSEVDGIVDLYLTSPLSPPSALTDDPEQEYTYPPDPDAARVLYSRWTTDDLVERDILAVDPDTGEITPVLATPGDEAMPRVSPDGSRIVFMSDEGAEEFDIWVMNADGTNPTKLTTNPDRDSSPAWSPDGTKIVYRARIDGASNIWTMNPDGTGLEQLTDDPAGDFDPIYSPDGSQIAFTSERAGNFDVWVMNADGSDPVNLTDHPAADEYPSWTDDGGGLTFHSDRYGLNLWIMRADGSEQTLFTDATPSAFGTAIGSLP